MRQRTAQTLWLVICLWQRALHDCVFARKSLEIAELMLVDMQDNHTREISWTKMVRVDVARNFADVRLRHQPQDSADSNFTYSCRHIEIKLEGVKCVLGRGLNRMLNPHSKVGMSPDAQLMYTTAEECFTSSKSKQTCPKRMVGWRLSFKCMHRSALEVMASTRNCKYKLSRS